MQKGFTLIEILIYISLLGILMSVLIVSAYSFHGQSVLLERKTVSLENNLLLHFNDYKN